MLSFNHVHESWIPLLQKALQEVDADYIKSLKENPNWLPGENNIFNAFSIPLSHVNYLLLGESPYPRAASANGYAFWDNAVKELWSEKGLSKTVNRATSLRNFLKMLFIAEGQLSPDNTTQEAIAALDKSHFISTGDELFQGMLSRGFLLLNASLVLSPQSVTKEAKYWQPFMNTLLDGLAKENPSVELLLWGNIAKAMDALPASQSFTKFYAEHPYNISFIHNSDIQDFFKPLKLLRKKSVVNI